MMKKLYWISREAIIIGLALFILSCKKEVPILITADITNITESSANCGGIITDEGYSTVISRGVCWSIGTTPTISDNKTTDGEGSGSFTSSITGLAGAAYYYVRAYATNNVGTGYGKVVSFATLSQLPTVTIASATYINFESATLNGNMIPLV
jgi:hypothetical protein